jgi:hypothetical protein
MVGRMQFLQ